MKLFILFISIFTVTVCVHLQAGIEDDIKAVLPSGAFLREYERIPDVKGDVYIGLYVLNSKSSFKKEYPNDQMDPNNLYFTCPEATAGQSIIGDYYLFSFGDKKLTSTLAVSSCYGDSLSLENSFSFYNTPENNCFYFNFSGGDCQNKATNTLEKTKLIQMIDLTGDNKRNEFVLTGTQDACGYINRLIAGYDEESKKVVIYPVNYSGKIYYWNYRFVPIDGTCSVVILCGDHGNETYERRDYGFNALTKQYDLIYEETKECQ
ncbi:MAG: hypothetical protein K8I03_01220 [Ignavibacteria bacterium]|nr:hypothetical protein [Ignavibacteria bacterium]